MSLHQNLTDIEIQYLQDRFTQLELNQFTNAIDIVDVVMEENFEQIKYEILELVSDGFNINQIAKKVGLSAGKVYFIKKRIAEALYIKEGMPDIDNISKKIDLPISLLFTIPCIGKEKRLYLSQQELTPPSQKTQRVYEQEYHPTPFFNFEQSSGYVAFNFRLEGIVLSNPEDHFFYFKYFNSKEEAVAYKNEHKNENIIIKEICDY